MSFSGAHTLRPPVKPVHPKGVPLGYITEGVEYLWVERLRYWFNRDYRNALESMISLDGGTWRQAARRLKRLSNRHHVTWREAYLRYVEEA